MTPARRHAILSALGWSHREFARRTGHHERHVRQWIGGSREWEEGDAWLVEVEGLLDRLPRYCRAELAE